MSDRVAVMSQGRIEQIGTSTEIYNHPETAFVASFVGENNLFTGRLVDARDGFGTIDSPAGRIRAANPHRLPVGAEALLFVRPERVRLGSDGAAGTGWNVIESEVMDEVFEGLAVNIFLRHPEGLRPIAVSVTNNGAVPVLAPGTPQRIAFAAEHAVLLPPSRLAERGSDRP
jgi:spermidine/putrescine transport system ATP-binding protein